MMEMRELARLFIHFRGLSSEEVETLYERKNLYERENHNSIKTYKARFIASSSSCTTTELSKLLTSCLTAVKNVSSSIVKRYMRDPINGRN